MTGFAGIRADQGPPLWVPLSFFLVAPAALVSAGVLLFVRPPGEGASPLEPTLVATVHLVTVGTLLPVMLGALTQMLPVVAGAVMPRPRLAYGVLALLLAGGAALVVGQATGDAHAFAVAWPLIGIAVLLFLVPAAVAFARSEVRTPTSRGLGLALAALALVVLAGARLAAVRAGLGGAVGWPAGGWPIVGGPARWDDVRGAHALIGTLGWVGGLIAAVSWQVLPMFFLAPAPAPRLTTSILACVSLSLAALGLASFVALPLSPWALAVPAALALAVAQPAWAIRALRARKRKRREASLRFWWLGMGAAPACLVLAIGSLVLDERRLPLLLGWAVLWAWAAAIVHGMLARIVPFLVWLHRCAPLVGQRDVPSAKELLTDREVSIGFALHAATLGLGVLAVVTGARPLWQLAGAGLAATGLWLLVEIAQPLRRAPPALPVS